MDAGVDDDKIFHVVFRQQRDDGVLPVRVQFRDHVRQRLQAFRAKRELLACMADEFDFGAHEDEIAFLQFGVDFADEIIDGTAFLVECDRRFVEIPCLRARIPVGEVLQALRTIRQVAVHLEFELRDVRHGIAPMSRRQRERPEGFAQLACFFGDDFQILVVVAADFVVDDAVVVVGDERCGDFLRAVVDVVDIGHERIGGADGIKIEIGEVVGIDGADFFVRLRKDGNVDFLRFVLQMVACKARMVHDLRDDFLWLAD